MLTLESFEKYTKSMKKVKFLNSLFLKRAFFQLSHNSYILLSVVSLSLFLTVYGCAPAISPGVKKSINQGLSFQRVKKNPDLYKGARVLWGGKIVSTNYREDGTLIEMIQIPLDMFDKPVGTISLSKGRFLILSEWFLDSEVYKKGKELTVAGIIKGAEVKKIGEFKYAFPVIEPIEIKLWEPVTGQPSYYNDPFFYDPFFYDPYFDSYFSPFPKRHRRYKRYPSDWHPSHGDCNFRHPPDYDDNC